jgi:hypothetical protein
MNPSTQDQFDPVVCRFFSVSFIMIVERIRLGNFACARIDNQYPVFGRFKETAVAVFRNPKSLLCSLPFCSV